MIGRSFKSVAWVAAIGTAAVSCYMFSARVAEERSGLAQLNAEIVKTEGAIKTLRTELGTRGRVQQLEHWASNEFGTVAPRPSQFIDGEVRLATLELAPEQAGEPPVRLARADATTPSAPGPAAPGAVLASAPAPHPAPTRGPARAEPSTPADGGLLHRAALARPVAHSTPAPARATTAAPRHALLDASTIRALGERARAETSRPAPARPARTR